MDYTHISSPCKIFGDLPYFFNYFRSNKPPSQIEKIHDPQEKWDKKTIKLFSLDKLLIDDFNEAYNK